MLEGCHIQIDVQVRPVEMGLMNKPNVVNRRDHGVLEPGVFFERQEKLSPFYKEPDPMPGDVLYFSLRSAFSRRG